MNNYNCPFFGGVYDIIKKINSLNEYKLLRLKYAINHSKHLNTLFEADLSFARVKLALSDTVSFQT